MLTERLLSSGLSVVESFSSPEPSYKGSASVRSSRRSSSRSRDYNVLLQVAQSFAFRIPLARDINLSSVSPSKLAVRQTNGDELPSSFVIDWGSPGAMGARKDGDGRKPTVKVWGMPEAEDMGEWEIGVFMVDSGRCVGSALVRIVENSNR